MAEPTADSAETTSAADKKAAFAATTPKPADSTPPSEEAPQKTQAPTPEGTAVALEGETTEQVGAGAGAAAPTETAAPASTGGDAPAPASEPAAPKTYSFSIGGAQCQITDNGNASAEFPSKTLWTTFGPKGNVKIGGTIPTPWPVVVLKVGGSLNYLLQVKDGVFNGATVAKDGSKYTVNASMTTGVHLGLGVGLSASVGVDAWLIEAGVGISGSASIGGAAPVDVAFKAVYDSADGTVKAAANVAIGKLTMPVLAKVSAFVYLDTIATDTYKKSWSLIEANLGKVLVGASKAKIGYQSGKGLSFDLKAPSFDYSTADSSVSFLGG